MNRLPASLASLMVLVLFVSCLSFGAIWHLAGKTITEGRVSDKNFHEPFTDMYGTHHGRRYTITLIDHIGRRGVCLVLKRAYTEVRIGTKTTCHDLSNYTRKK